MSSRFKNYAITVDTPMKQMMQTENLAFSHRPTAIITTLHDSQVTEFDMKHYIENGLRIAGFRSTWIPQEHKIKLINKLKKATEWCCQKYDASTWPIALAIEIPNAVISTGFLDNNKSVLLKKDSIVAITSDIKYFSKCDQNTIFINDQYTLPTVPAGTEITLGFGKIVMYCNEVIDKKTLKCKVIKEGTLDDQEIVCFRGIKLLKPPLAKRDMDLIQFAKEHEFDMITVNAIRYPSTVNTVKDLFKKAYKPLIISTICEQEGLNNIDDIIEVSDGLILAREYLAATIKNKHYLLRIQMQVSAKCKLLGKPFFISGNILEGSIDKGILAGSDLNDVINAVAQGAGLVLRVYKNAHDTTTALQLLNDIFSIVDTSFAYQEQLWREPNYSNMIPVNAAVACVQSCVLAAKAMATTVIIVPTVSGQTVRQLSHWSDNFTIIAITSSQLVARQLLLHSGVISVVYSKTRLPDWEEEMVSRIRFAASYGIRFQLLKFGEMFVVLRKQFPDSVYCDRVGIWKVVTIEESHRIELMSTQVTCRIVGVKGAMTFKCSRQHNDDLEEIK